MSKRNDIDRELNTEEADEVRLLLAVAVCAVDQPRTVCLVDIFSHTLPTQEAAKAVICSEGKISLDRNSLFDLGEVYASELEHILAN